MMGDDGNGRRGGKSYRIGQEPDKKNWSRNTSKTQSGKTGLYGRGATRRGHGDRVETSMECRLGVSDSVFFPDAATTRPGRQIRGIAINPICYTQITKRNTAQQNPHRPLSKLSLPHPAVYTRTTATPPKNATTMAAPILKDPIWMVEIATSAALLLLLLDGAELTVPVPFTPPASFSSDEHLDASALGVLVLASPLKEQASDAFFCSS